MNYAPKGSHLKPSLNGEEEKVRAEKLSQTTTSLQNKLTLNKMNPAPKGSNLKPSLNGEEEKVKAEKLSQTTTTLPNKLTLYKMNYVPKGSSFNPLLNGDESNEYYIVEKYLQLLEMNMFFIASIKNRFSHRII